MKFQISKLSNDLPLVTYSMEGFRTISINFIVGVGSRYENQGEEGLSHFLEHMAFKGTKNRSAKKIAEEFDQIGGQFNAYTSKEATIYYAKVVDEHLEKGLDIISDIIENSIYEEEEIKREFGVICQEIAASKDSPDDLCHEHLMMKSYSNQPIGKPILGTEESISKFTTINFKDFVSKHYSASNSILSLAGNINRDYAQKLAEKKFSFLQKVISPKVERAVYTGGESFVQKELLEQSSLMVAFESCDNKNLKQIFNTQILSLILGGGTSSRLFQSIREQMGLAYSVGSFNSSYSDTGLFTLYAGTAPEKLKIVVENMFIQINKLRTNITEEELKRAKDQVKSCIIMSSESTSYRSEEQGKNYFRYQREISDKEVIDTLDSININNLKLAADKIFSSKIAFSVVGPNFLDFNISDFSKIL
ncbi:MAG: pitrilysin family protein [Rickettsiaceae bacterium]|nr:pitrilysin family protein [Rickettsiaceae bacterium]